MASLDHSASAEFMDLPQGDKVQAEYVWIDAFGGLRSKTKTLDASPSSISELPIWNFDGSSTGQAPGEDSEVLLHPVAIYRDPFRRGNNILVMNACYKPDGTPTPDNLRHEAAQIMERANEEHPWFGIEQEFTMFEKDKITPLGWPRGGFPGSQGPYYCSAGADVAFGRPVVEAHYRACLYAGIKVAGCNAEVMPGQWEYQVGPCEGISMGDELWMSRYIMLRVAERFRVVVSFDPKPIPGDWNGAGCHTNYSTLSMRNPGGYEHILSAIRKMEPKHLDHIAVYGAGNERRLTGKHETASIDQFSYGVANRGASIRIPRVTEADGCGYFEDRRPASNCDPYAVTNRIVKTTVLDE